jgi:transposase
VPDEAAEAVRDLLRCREDVQEDLLRWRHRLVKSLARHGRIYREGRHWTGRHWTWLRSQRFALPALERTYQEYRFTVEQLLARRAARAQEILALAETEPYRERVRWLCCFRGIDTLSAMGLLTEVGDFPRLPHPRELKAYLRLVPSEDSTGGRERRGGITKAGNTHTRRILVEAAWHYRHPPRLGAALTRRSQGQPPAVLAQAWQAQLRLHRRVPASGRARETAPGGGGRRRPRVGGLPLGRPDAGGACGPGPPDPLHSAPAAHSARGALSGRGRNCRENYL